jgi:hypothetical protein
MRRENPQEIPTERFYGTLPKILLEAVPHIPQLASRSLWSL